jgi:cytochrome b involved in lipid metabolism
MKYTIDQVAKHNKQGILNTSLIADDIYMVLSGKVYDVTQFMEEHPGGDEVLLEVAGMDATEAFEEIGHSDDARQLLKPMYFVIIANETFRYVGEFDAESSTATKDTKKDIKPNSAPKAAPSEYDFTRF